MKKTLVALSVVALSSSLFAKTVHQQNISLDIAQKLATEVISKAREEKVNVSVVVLDRGGNIVVSLKDDKAGLHTTPTAEKKAFTSLTFGIPSSEFAKRVEKVPNLTEIDNVTTLGGGLPIKLGDDTIGSIGVGGAPSGTIDENLAKYGIEQVNTLLK